MSQSDQHHRPGSEGEHYVQEVLGTTERADRFYRDQMLDHLNPTMKEFIARQEMLFIATADAKGECDSSFRAGPPGFVHVIDDRTLAYPEYRGNGVFASAGNVVQNPHIGLMFLDFQRDRIGLHVNGKVKLTEDERLRAHVPDLPLPQVPGQRALMWMVVQVEEAYIHCRKHIPHLRKVGADEAWGTDDMVRKGGDYFGAKQEREAREREAREREAHTHTPAGTGR
ncbi:pyridoxamine 5'-phosphate oxidase family protein [Nocardiopsis exhalans]|uniref:Pyridoxamine 5'-phosphate oxidase family protein n=1 Tax=Nocardiopsis exhalans TaxID=163604 RepID=A0ABY5DCC8_9ACTN|nr:pyridoxamine 5'-phosphate oxidase family protein [Nocardiopsis exhalans]USY21682.1 pyridoxamine 5'-phosphate oxidase family protein [Nocardiopsis exhalans]